MWILTLITAIIVFSVLVVVHEWGHYISSVALGIPVDEFAVGFGKQLYSSKKGRTRFTLRLLPFGGYCRYVDSEMAEATGETPFNREKPWKRLIVFVSGPAMNLVTALLLAVLTLMIYGDYSVVLHDVSPGSPAAQAGMLPGDMLLSIDGKQLAYTLSSGVDLTDADPAGVSVTVLRGGERLTLRLEDIYDAEAGRNMMGVTIIGSDARRPFTLTEAVSASFAFMWYFVREFFNVIAGIFRAPSTATEQLGGPVAVVGLMSAAVRGGLEVVLRMVILLSANLAVVNLFPIPGLDGAQFALTVVEMARGKPLSEKVQGGIQLAGFALIMALAVFLTISDIGKLLGGGL